ncbi:uncharacterized protein [Anabrus simplex]|uniref:uncharacterized protein n=1 Tax=Anabrus simplex TaxID=316456 RepID=UPI0035A37B81
MAPAGRVAPQAVENFQKRNSVMESSECIKFNNGKKKVSNTSGSVDQVIGQRKNNSRSVCVCDARIVHAEAGKCVDCVTLLSELASRDEIIRMLREDIESIKRNRLSLNGVTEVQTEAWSEVSTRCCNSRPKTNHDRGVGLGIELRNKFQVLESITSSEEECVKINNIPAITRKPALGLKKKECKVVVYGDSHGRGIAVELGDMLPETEVVGFVKPGALFKEVLQSDMEEMGTLNENDYVVIIAGANDIARNEASNVISGVKKALCKLKTTNVILCNIPHRHDLIEWSCVNKLVDDTNRRLQKTVKCFQNTEIIDMSNMDRGYFTNHGMHLSRRGKKQQCNMIRKKIQQTSGTNITTNAIPLLFDKDEEVAEHLQVMKVRRVEEVVEVSATTKEGCLGEENQLKGINVLLPQSSETAIPESTEYSGKTCEETIEIVSSSQLDERGEELLEKLDVGAPSGRTEGGQAKQPEIRTSSRTRKRPVLLEQDFLRWVKYRCIEDIHTIDNDRYLVFGSEMHITFYNVELGRSMVYQANDPDKGYGVACIACHPKHNVFAYAEKRSAPLIYVRDFPSCNGIITLPEEASTEEEERSPQTEEQGLQGQ